MNFKSFLIAAFIFRAHDSNRSRNASVSKGSKVGNRNPAFQSTRSTLISSANRKNVPGIPASEKSANIRSSVQVCYVKYFKQR